MVVSAAKLKELTDADQNVGTYLLTTIASTGYGEFGKYLLGIIVALACLTTACGLVVAVSQYFHSIIPKIPYKVYVVAFTLISLILANMGLNQVITLSVPVLSILYPIGITTVLLILMARFVPMKPIVQQFTICVVTIVSIISVAVANQWIHFDAWKHLPLVESSLEWFPIAVVAVIIGYLISIGFKTKTYCL